MHLHWLIDTAWHCAASHCHVRCMAMYIGSYGMQACAQAPVAKRSWWYRYNDGQRGIACSVAWCRKARLNMDRCPHLDSRWNFICAADIVFVLWMPFAMLVVRVMTTSLHVCCILHMTRPSVSCSTSWWGNDWSQACKCNNLAMYLPEVTSFTNCSTFSSHTSMLHLALCVQHSRRMMNTETHT